MKLLPSCDVDIGSNGLPEIGRDCFSNEFFNRALNGFAERIADGEFTPAMKARLNIESSRRRIDPWKEKFFEEYWGQLALADSSDANKKNENREKWERLERNMKNELKSPLKTIYSPKRSSPKRNADTSPRRLTSSPRNSPKKCKKEIYPEINHSNQTVIKSRDALNAVKSLQTNYSTVVSLIPISRNIWSLKYF